MCNLFVALSSTNLGFFLRLAQRHSVMLSSLTTVCMLPVSVSMFALALCDQEHTRHKNNRNGSKKPSHTLFAVYSTFHTVTKCFAVCKHKNNYDTLRISSVVRWCFEWISSCKFMRDSWYFRPSCGSVTSLSRLSSSSISCKGQIRVVFDHRLCNTRMQQMMHF